MRGYLSFKLPEEREEFEEAQKGGVYKLMFDEVWDRLFRPRHKHGYSDQRLNDLLQNNVKSDELMDLLEEIYKEIRTDYE